MDSEFDYSQYSMEQAQECYEEQNIEKEALESIFMDEFVEISSVPQDEVSLTLEKFVHNYDLIIMSDQTEPHTFDLSILLHIGLPVLYPQFQKPVIEIIIKEPLNKDDLDKLNQKKDQVLEENLGSQVLFELSSELKVIITERKQEIEKQKSLNVKEEETKKTEEWNDYMGQFNVGIKLSSEIKTFTPVTKESYFQWRSKFESEMDNPQNVVKEKTNISEKLSGKEFFLNKKEDQTELTYLAEQIQARKENEGEDGKKEEVFYYEEELFDDIFDMEEGKEEIE